MKRFPEKDARELVGMAGGENKSTKEYSKNPTEGQSTARELLAIIISRLQVAHQVGDDLAVHNLALILSRVGSSLEECETAR